MSENEPKDNRPHWRGTENPNFRHGAYVDGPLSEEDRKWLEGKRAEYLKAYPWLNKPAAVDMLEKSLRLQMRIDRIQQYIDKLIAEGISLEKIAGIASYEERLIRTWRLLINSMGATFRPQQYVSEKERKAVLTPEEMLERMTRDEP